MPDSPAPRYLLIVQRERPEVYARLQSLTDGYVTFVRDRRRGERRRPGAPVTAERRIRDRRGDPPSTWPVFGFVLHRVEAPPA
jgi:hypothetical protein